MVTPEVNRRTYPELEIGSNVGVELQTAKHREDLLG